MEIEGIEKSVSKKMKRFLLILNCILLGVGNSGGPLIMRLYFLRGGKRIWLSSFLETTGCPIIFIPLLIVYLHRRRRHQSTPLFFTTPPLFFAAAFIGVLTGLDNYLYAYGVSLLPISTSALINTSHLVFTAGFAFLLVRQKLTSFSLNAIFLLTMGSVLLAVHSNGDRPEGESNKEYYLGFIMTVAAAALYGLVLPMVELMYKKTKQRMSYTVVMEVQLVMCFFSTLLCCVGMFINNDFKAIPKEAREYELGKRNYYLVLIGNGILWQCFFLGSIGVIFTSSSLCSAIITTADLPITQILGVLLYKEKYKTEKALSLILSLWGFLSYFYGQIKDNNKNQKKNEDQNPEDKQTSDDVA
ncbi:purine permease 3-like [Impatiens glandulifera]|uniref:purine permease 3-like n=1 Tax=Impatiens glandulifera TaxID=253017 RepID=UPI001FB0FBE4|nr:purine permease 3-like [Impatiens glandulifera]